MHQFRPTSDRSRVLIRINTSIAELVRSGQNTAALQLFSYLHSSDHVTPHQYSLSSAIIASSNSCSSCSSVGLQLHSYAVRSVHPIENELKDRNEEGQGFAPCKTLEVIATRGQMPEKIKGTNPKPFRLRKDERGILREANLEKRLLLPQALKLRIHSFPSQVRKKLSRRSLNFDYTLEEKGKLSFS